MATTISSECENKVTISKDEKAAWFAPQISRLDIQRTLATSGDGMDFGHVST